MAQRDLRRVRSRAEQLEQARQALRDAVMQAHASGESVRDIAPYAALSPSRVYELLKEATDEER